MATFNSNEMAKSLKSLHIPGKPIIMANVYDGATAQVVSSLASSKALASASYGVARAAGVTDPELTMETNLAAIRVIAPIARAAGKPFSADMQDGYEDRLEEAYGLFIDAGVAGCNLEDYSTKQDRLFTKDEAVERIKRALKVAAEKGVPDFVVNARCDVLVHGGQLDEVLERGKAYLAAGATTVFVWGGGPRGTSREEIVKMVEAFEGRLNVRMKLGKEFLGPKELAEIGVARISVGPELQHRAMDFYAQEAEKMLTGSD